MGNGEYSTRLNFMSNIQVIPALRKDSQKKRVAGYARVSTADEHQDSSYRLQIQELEDSIRANPKFEFVGVFKDRKSGSNIKGRQQFNDMIELALMGEIDVIITKSITRFARNLLDTISIIRELKIKNVEVFFQKERISTLDPSIEMILTVLAMHAEEELKNISANTLWSKRRIASKGGNLTTYLYGYDIKKETWTIKANEARVVRLIFDMYVNNKTYREMSEKLYEMKIKTPTGKERWGIGTFESMLQNEKYAGHMALYKTFIHQEVRIRSSRLQNEENMILNHHKAIIDPSIYEKAMEIRKMRTKNKLEGYVPLKDRVTPYYQFVYSTQNENYLRFVLEKPKGKYEIPTLYCYNKERRNRIMITVNNLFAVMNDAFKKLSEAFINGLSFTEIINDNLISCESKLVDSPDNKTYLLNKKVALIEAKRNLSLFIGRVKSFRPLDNTDAFKYYVRGVIIESDGAIRINLNLLNGNFLNHQVLKSAIELRVGNSNKMVPFFIYL